MNPWPFVTAAYAVTLASTAMVVIVSHLAMKRAERPIEDDRDR